MLKSKVLTILKNSGKYVSGQEISRSLGVSRTAVWKAIGQLKKEGYELDAVSSKGYRLTGIPEIFLEEELISRMPSGKFARKIKIYEEIGSTNTEAKRLAEEEAETDGLLVISEVQSAGRGRRGRSWESPKGSGIWMSLVIKPDISPVNASMITLVTAMAVTKVIRENVQADAFIKWPNDVVINGRKLCGILTEMSSEEDYINYIIIGIGINVNTVSFPKEIREIATSLFKEVDKKIDRSDLIVAFIKQLEIYYDIFLQTQDLSNLMSEYNELLVNKGKEVMIMGPQTEVQGIGLGIDETGRLMVESEGKVIEVMSGEVSVRGINGYV